MTNLREVLKQLEKKLLKTRPSEVYFFELKYACIGLRDAITIIEKYPEILNEPGKHKEAT